ncbi:MAG: MarC family protein [Fusobacteriaceae bacterium]|jgi:multiple antibiotic resistance protein|nr:MarC family protein [Fusobacteriaceae bacterium]MBP6467429.1 MarC family protein [Fusobacteriaceae bacterium]MBP9596355.1 MarC family protein [Fusobacteriaceae bacterium]MBU9918612.1 MarC family protein [Fusobacteriaceae bacterium]
MNEFFNHFILSCASLIAVLNPFGNVPLFVSLTEHMKTDTRQKLFKLIVYTGFTIIVVFSLIGDLMMTYLFRIDMKEIRMAGGIILIIAAIKNLLFSSKKTKLKTQDDDQLTEQEEIQQGIIPLAFPMMVGPGSMTTILITRRDFGPLYALLVAFIVFFIIHILFKYSSFIEKIFGKLVLYVLGKVMQIFIMAIGIRIFFMGLFEVLGK